MTLFYTQNSPQTCTLEGLMVYVLCKNFLRNLQKTLDIGYTL
nr:MAG TPA: hypothetical protein [Caudoviricetes sp.]